MALSARAFIDIKNPDTIQGGHVILMVIEDAKKCYQGGHLELVSSGREVQPVVAGSNLVYAGMALETVDNADDGLSVDVLQGAVLVADVTGATVATIGDIVYALNDGQLTLTAGSTNVAMGWQIGTQSGAVSIVKMRYPGMPIS